MTILRNIMMHEHTFIRLFLKIIFSNNFNANQHFLQKITTFLKRAVEQLI